MDNDFFEAATVGQFELSKKKIHISFRKTGPRSLTIIEGLDEDLDLELISKAMKKEFSCACTVQKNKEGNEIIQIQGNKVDEARKWLVKVEILTQREAEERIHVHGF